MGRAVLKFCLFISASISASAFSLPFNPYPGKHLGWWSAASLSLRYWNDLWHRNVQVVKLSLSYLLVEGLVLSWIIVTIIMWYVSIIFISCCILYFVAIRPPSSEAERYEYRLHEIIYMAGKIQWFDWALENQKYKNQPQRAPFALAYQTNNIHDFTSHSRHHSNL